MASKSVMATEDGSTYSDPVSFALTETMTTYTTNLTVYGTRFRVRWTPSAANKRFFLDDVIFTSASSGGDDIEEFTVTGTSHTFTNLTPETTYYTRVKGDAGWSDVETFSTASVYDQWIADNGYPEEPESAIAANGHTYWENYIADIDPTSSNFLEITFTSAVDGTFTIDPISPNRDYQLLYYTDLTSDADPAISNLNTSVDTSFPFPTNATGFGRIRVTLHSP